MEQARRDAPLSRRLGVAGLRAGQLDAGGAGDRRLGRRVDVAEDVGAALEEALAQDGRPSVLELISSEDETPLLAGTSGAVPAQQAAY